MFYRNVRPLVNTTFHNATGDYEFVTEGIINVGFQTESEYISGVGSLYLEVDFPLTGSNSSIVTGREDISSSYAWLASSQRDNQMGEASESNPRTLVITQGLYETGMIQLSSYVNIIGLGCPTIKLADSTDATLLYGEDVTSIKLQGFNIDGNGSNNAASNGVHLKESTFCSLLDLNIHNSTNRGIYLEGSTDINISNIISGLSGTADLQVSASSTRINIDNFLSKDAADYGVYITESSYININNLQVSGATDDCLAIVDGEGKSSDININNTHLFGSTADKGCHLVGTENISFTNTSFNNNNLNGVLVTNSKNTFFANCFANNNGGTGFNIDGSISCNLNNCSANSNLAGAYGIQYNDVVRGSISACTAYDNDAGGFYTKGAAADNQIFIGCLAANTTGSLQNYGMRCGTDVGVGVKIKVSSCNFLGNLTANISDTNSRLSVTNTDS